MGGGFAYSQFITWKGFFAVVGGGIVFSLLLLGILNIDRNVISTTSQTMKVVANTTSRDGRQIELADRSGNDSLSVSGDKADAIVNAPGLDGDSNPNHEIRVTYDKVRVTSPDGKGVIFRNRLKYWRPAYHAEMW